MKLVDGKHDIKAQKQPTTANSEQQQRQPRSLGYSGYD